MRDENNKAVGAAQFFIKTGEIWGFNSAAVLERDRRIWLSYVSIPLEWLIFFNRAMALYTKLGVSGPFQVEAGVTGLGGVFWGNDFGGASSALETEVYFQATNQSWEKEARLEFLTDTFNRLRDAFNQRRITKDQYPRG